MPAPEASPAALTLYEALTPAFTFGDENRGYPLLRFLNGLSAGTLSKVHRLVTEQEGRPGWQVALDPDLADLEDLPWLAQFGGANLRPDMDEAQQRDAVKAPEVFRRGTIPAIVQVAERRLTGTKTVIVTERYTEKAWRLRIETLAGETPEPTITQAEIIAEQKPVGIVLFFNTRVNWTWGEAKESVEFPTWGDVKAGFASWHDYRTYEP